MVGAEATKKSISGVESVVVERLEKLDNMKKIAKWKVPSMVSLMLRKSVLSPLVACLAAGALYSLFHFYTIYVYLSKYAVNGNDLAVILMYVIGFRLVASPAVYFTLNFVKQKRWIVQGRKSIFLFGLSGCLGFILIWHPWYPHLIGLQLSLAIVLFEVSMENIVSELSRVFELQLTVLKRPIHLTLLVEIVFTTGTLAILCVQLTTQNTSHLLGLELAFLVVTIIAGGCFLFCGLFYPTTAQLTLLKSKKQVVSTVSLIHNRVSEGLNNVINGTTNGNTPEYGLVPSRNELDSHAGFVQELARLLTNPHFYWPCIGRSIRQSRMLFNFAFLMLFTQLFLVSFGRFSETGFSINLYLLLCLTMHVMLTKLLWKVLRDSGPLLVNCTLSMLTVALNVLILICGRNTYFLTLCYIFFENVLSSSCSQITYAMFQTNFLENDAKLHPNSKPLSKKKVAFVSGLLASTAEYLVLALTLVLLFYSSNQFEAFVQNPAPFAEKCHRLDPMVASSPPTFLVFQRIGEDNNPISNDNISESIVNSTEYSASNLLVLNSNETLSENSTLLQMAQNVKYMAEEESIEPDESSSEEVDTSLCDNLLDLAFVVVVLLSTVLAATELLVMKLYKRHFVWKARKHKRAVVAKIL